MAKLQITPDDVAKVREWFASRGGVILWHNLEIGASRPSMATPATHDDGTPATRPNWSMGDPETLAPSDVEIAAREYLEAPIDYPPCEYCKGTGRRPLADIAKARQSSVDEVRAFLAQDERYKTGAHTVDDTSCTCWACDGKGSVHSPVRVAIRKRYWGYDISETGKKRAAALARKLGPDVQCDWRHDDNGRAALIFYRETISPFTLS